MKKQEAIDAIRNLLKFSETQKMAEAKLADGTIVQWEGDLGEGVAINVIGEDGNTMPAPDAVHVLEDGTEITTVGGLVTDIKPKEEKVEVEVEMSAEKLKELEQKFAEGSVDIAALSVMVKALMNYCYGWEMQETGRKEAVDQAIAVYKESFNTLIEDNKNIQAKLEAYEEKFKSINETITNTETNVNEKFSKVLEIVEKIADEPAVKPEPVKHVLFKKKSDKSKSVVEMFNELDKQTRKG